MNKISITNCIYCDRCCVVLNVVNFNSITLFFEKCVNIEKCGGMNILYYKNNVFNIPVYSLEFISKYIDIDVLFYNELTKEFYYVFDILMDNVYVINKGFILKNEIILNIEKENIIFYQNNVGIIQKHHIDFDKYYHIYLQE